MAADTIVLTPPPGNLNWQAGQGLVPSAYPSGDIGAGAMLVTANSVQQTLATWLASIPAITLPLSVANGGTGQTALGASSFSATGGTLAARRSARMQLQWVTGAVVTADTVYFAYDAPYPGVINSMTYFAGTGSFTIAVQISGTPVTGLGSVAVNSATPATTNATAANSFTAGQIIEGVISSPASSPTDVLLSLNVTWSA
jgi:hypothetical protein